MLKSLKLVNFRKVQSATYTFSEGINYIYGPNAVGKTTLLEALHCLITGRSFRTHNHEELVREGAKGYYIEVHFVKEGLSQTLSLSYENKKKRVLYNGSPLQNLSMLFGILKGTILLPEDEMLIKGGPSYRRLYLDLNLAQIKPLYIYHLSRYTRALKQRNALLKEEKREHLGLFEKEMAHSASHLTLMRDKLTQELSEDVERVHALLSNHTELLELSYLGQTSGKQEELEESFRQLLEEEREKALILGYTKIGPHRDDLKITLSKRGAKSFASEGQKRLATTTLRLAQWHYLKRVSGESPLLCIDDLGLALDKMRTKLLYDYVKDLGQLFITSYNEPPSHLLEGVHPIALA